MLDPCYLCKCGYGRKVDCLAPYPHLRAIGNSPGGFTGYTGTAQNWSISERWFYDLQIRQNQPSACKPLPDIL